jgi:hypothetical protein
MTCAACRLHVTTHTLTSGAIFVLPRPHTSNSLDVYFVCLSSMPFTLGYMMLGVYWLLCCTQSFRGRQAERKRGHEFC